MNCPMEHYVDPADEQIALLILEKKAYYPGVVMWEGAQDLSPRNPVFLMFARRHDWPSVIRVRQHMGLIDGQTVYMFFAVYTQQ